MKGQKNGKKLFFNFFPFFWLAVIKKEGKEGRSPYFSPPFFAKKKDGKKGEATKSLRPFFSHFYHRTKKRKFYEQLEISLTFLLNIFKRARKPYFKSIWGCIHNQIFSYYLRLNIYFFHVFNFLTLIY
jgi:hypothetical protein